MEVSIDWWMDKEDMYIQWNITQPYKDWIWVSAEVDEPRAYSKWSKSEKNKYRSYIWKLEKWYLWNYLQGRNGDANVENGLLDTVGKERGVYGESSTNIYMLSGVRWIAGELLCNARSPTWLSVVTLRDGMEGEREAQKRGDICVIMTDLLIVWQKPTQHCKAITLQLKDKLKNSICHILNIKKIKSWACDKLSFLSNSSYILSCYMESKMYLRGYN